MTSPIRRLPGYRIRTLLRARGLTQHDVAKRAKVSQAMVSKVVTRHSPPASKAGAAVWKALQELLA